MTIGEFMSAHAVEIIGGVWTVGGAIFGWLAHRRLWLRDFRARMADEESVVVLDVDQTYVDSCLAGREPNSDGGVELTEAEKAHALELAVDKLLAHLGVEAIDRALRIAKLPRVPSFVRTYFSSRVEARVKRLNLDKSPARGKVALELADRQGTLVTPAVVVTAAPSP